MIVKQLTHLSAFLICFATHSVWSTAQNFVNTKQGIGKTEYKFDFGDLMQDLKDEVDSLSQLEGQDSLIIEKMVKLSGLYEAKSMDSALFYAYGALARAEALNQSDLMAVSHYYAGQIYEHYEEWEQAHNEYLRWFKIRRGQESTKYRWALKGMRRFYTKTRNFENLELIDDEWVKLCDAQFDNDVVAPSFTSGYVDAELAYTASMQSMINNLVNAREYETAETRALHMIEKLGPGFQSQDWLNANCIYPKVFQIMVRESGRSKQPNVSQATEWCQRWMKSLVNHNVSPSTGLLSLTYMTHKTFYEDRRLGMLLLDTWIPYAYLFDGDTTVIQMLSNWRLQMHHYYCKDDELNKGQVCHDAFRHAIRLTYLFWESSIGLSRPVNENALELEIQTALDGYEKWNLNEHDSLVESLRDIRENTEDKALRKSIKKSLKELKKKS